MQAARPGGADARSATPLLSRWDHPDRPPLSRIAVGPGTCCWEMRDHSFHAPWGTSSSHTAGVSSMIGWAARELTTDILSLSSHPVPVPALRGRRSPSASSSAHGRSSRRFHLLLRRRHVPSRSCVGRGRAEQTEDAIVSRSCCAPPVGLRGEQPRPSLIQCYEQFIRLSGRCSHRICCHCCIWSRVILITSGSERAFHPPAH